MMNCRMPGLSILTAALPVLLGFSLSTFAQNDSLAPAVAVKSDTGLSVTGSLAVAVQPADPKNEKSDRWEQEPLRDPFWPVGFFPEGWQKKVVGTSDLDADGSGWKAALRQVRISGTSKMGARTAAIINGELKNEGDQVEVLQNGQVYRWQITGIDADGQVQLKKLGIK